MIGQRLGEPVTGTITSRDAQRFALAAGDRNPLYFDEAAARHYGDVVVERSLAGEPISGFDAQIAAICRVNQVALATRNTDDFAGLGLELLNPWQRTG